MNIKLKNGLKINLIITLATSFLSFLTNKYFSEYMGAETLGLMRLFTQIIAYLNLADMGIGVASAYSLYKPLSEKNEYQVNLVISTVDYFYKRIAILILTIGLFFNLFLHKLIETNSYGYLLYIYWSLYVLNTAVSYVYAKYSILFTANQEYEKVRLIQGSGRVIFQILQIICLIKLQSFLFFIIVMILENLYLFLFYHRHYESNYNIKKVKGIDKNIIKDSKNLFWHKLGGVIVFNTDYIVLSKFTSLVTIAIYSSYLIVYQMLITLIGILSNVLTPIIGKFVAENEKKDIYIKWQEMYVFYFYISTIFIICTYNLIIPFVKLWLGEEYILPNLTVILILINLFIQMTRGVTETFKMAEGFFDDTYAPFLESGLNLIFSIVLVQKIGLDGVIIGTIISNVVVILILKPILVFKRCFEKSGLEYLKISGIYFFLTGISIVLCQLLMEKILLNNIGSWLDWIFKSSLVGIISLFVVTIVFLLDGKFRKILKKYKRG
ncbi:lipopolysaccharide biosynthesis protein (plasmid) [Cetobacterium somerae]|uniref:lipopolysaccharide biosynthesis protein n=1 Tax=Cetobacterium somerae TaxID=188913 RepID=UPI003D7686F0